MVQRPDGSGSDPAQICDEQPLGRPRANRSFRASAYLGVLDKRSAAWRFAVGPTLKYVPISEADDAYEFGAETPLYLRMSLIKGALLGIVRLTPSFAFTHASDGTDEVKFLMAPAVLADRSMFPSAGD